MVELNGGTEQGLSRFGAVQALCNVLTVLRPRKPAGDLTMQPTTSRVDWPARFLFSWFRSWPSAARRNGTLPLLVALLAWGCEQETDLGTPCTIKAPCANGVCGFALAESYVERPSQKCETACVVHRLDNGTRGAIPANPERICDAAGGPPGCVTQAQLDHSSYCSCRCNGSKGDDDFCECPDGFACTWLVPGVASGDGSYCVRFD
jgi:hypothetical protein